MPQGVHSFISALPYLGASAGVLSLAWAAFGGARSRYRHTLGSRRELTRRLNQLSCGASGDYVNFLLGVPKFHSKLGLESRSVFILKHAIVMVQYGESATVQAFSICTTDRRFRFNTTVLSSGCLSVRLGRSHFTDADPGMLQGYYGFQGAARSLYAEIHYFGRPAAYQNYALSNTTSGVDSAGATETGVSISGASGAFVMDAPEYLRNKPQVTDAELYKFRRFAVVNTFAVVSARNSDTAGRLALEVQPDDTEAFELGRSYFSVGGIRSWIRSRRRSRLISRAGEDGGRSR